MTTLPIMPAFEENNIAVTLQSSDFFAPYAAVTVQSIIDNATAENNYDIIITTLNITEETADKFCFMADGKDNISVRVVNVEEIFKKYICLDEKTYGKETIIRTMLAEILANYDKTLNVDCDMIFCADAAELYNYDIDGLYLGAVKDLYSYTSYNSLNKDKYFNEHTVKNIIQLPSIESEINGGMLLLNLKKIRKDFTVTQIVDYMVEKKLKFYEQDAFSHFFFQRTRYIGFEWNWKTKFEDFLDENKFSCLGSGDYYISSHRAAAKNIKNLHFLDEVKPWHDPSMPFSAKWWNVAFKSPFYEVIEQRRLNIKEKDKPTRLLFICSTVMQLINVLNIKFNLYPNVKADIIFTESTDFSKYIEPVERLGMFEHIYRSGYNTTVDWKKTSKTAPGTYISKKPSKHRNSVLLNEKYSDLFVAINAPNSKLTYYQIIKSGIVPRVHFYEDGANGYVSSDTIDHSVYKINERFENNIYEILFYEPQLHSVEEKHTLSVLPKIRKNNREFLDVLYSVFGKVELPKEKYIFFNECFAVDGCASDDIEILDRIAEKVGKENITVKTHPRSKTEEKFYKMHGYRIFAEKTVPWEMFVLCSEIENKVLISVSSNMLFYPSIISDKDVPALFLRRVMLLSKRPATKSTAYEEYFGKAISFMNLKQKMAFCPNDINELDVVIDYLEGEF